jgi:molybdopterin-containing oxidoreductase family membrane subunit
MYGGGGGGEKYLATVALVKGPLKVTFWGGEVVVGVLLPLALLLLPGWKKSGTPCVAAIMVVIGMFANKVNMLLAPQTIPVPLFGRETYRVVIPSMVEMSIVGGAIAFIILAYSLVDRFELLTHDA